MHFIFFPLNWEDVCCWEELIINEGFLLFDESILFVLFETLFLLVLLFKDKVEFIFKLCNWLFEFMLLFPELIPDFATLLQHPDWDVKLACAIRMLVDISCEENDKDCAANTIKEYINTHHTADTILWRMRLRDLGLL